MNWLKDALPWLSLPLLLLLSVVIARKKLFREFPLFFIYVLTVIGVGLVRFSVYKTFSPRAYFYVYWWSNFLALVVTFLAIYETFLKKIFPRSSKTRIYKYLFPAVVVVVGLIGFSSALSSPDKRAAFYITSRIFDFIRSGVIGFFVLLILVMGREFSGYEFGIASGFGVQAAVALANAAMKSRPNPAHTLDRYESIAYDLACLIWLWSFSKADKPPVGPRPSIDVQTLHEARKWESALKDWLTPGKK